MDRRLHHCRARSVTTVQRDVVESEADDPVELLERLALECVEHPGIDRVVATSCPTPQSRGSL
jgi:hypothetical protein